MLVLAMMALGFVRVVEGFILTPNPPTTGSSNSYPCTAAATSITIIPSGQTYKPFMSRRANDSRQRRVGGKLTLLYSDGGAQKAVGAATTRDQEGKAPAAAGARRQPPARQRRKKTASVEGSIEMKRQAEVKELKTELQRFASLRMWRRAMDALNKAKADGLPITASIYTHAINVMSKGGRWKEALELLEEMIVAGNSRSGDDARPKIAPSVVSYNAAITACSRGGKVPEALRLLEMMSSRSGLSPDIYSYAAVMSGLAKTRNPDRAIKLLEEMRLTEVEPDVVCLKMAMEACKSKGASKQAAVVLEQVRELDPVPDASTLIDILTPAIGACVTDGAWEQAIDWLTDARMANGGSLPPAAAYAAAANACARAGQGIRAHALITELENGGGGNGGGARPTLECYNAVVLGYAIAGNVKEALRTLKEVVPNAGLKPDTDGFNHVLQGLAKAKDWKTALTLLDEQRSGEFPNAPPDSRSYNAAISACGWAGQVQPAVAILDTMRASSRQNPRLKPNRYSYGGVLHACREAGDAATALRLLQSMKKDGIGCDQRCSLSAFSAVAAAGREDEAAEILEEMIRSRVGTSEGALTEAREMLVEALGAGAGAGGGSTGGKFARAMAAFDVLEATQRQRRPR